MNKKLVTVLAVAIAFAPISAIAGEPATFPATQLNIVEFEVDKTYHFDFDVSVVTDNDIAAAKAKATELGEFLRDNPDRVIRLEGFTDETGTEEYNLLLSQERINEIAAFLEAAGASPSQIIKASYGEMTPLRDGHSDEAWAANRRIRVRLIMQ